MGFKGTRRFTEVEKDVIKRKFDPRHAEASSKEIIAEISERFGITRSVSGVKSQAKRMGLSRHIFARNWDEGELAILHDCAERLPVYKIKMKLDKYCTRNSLGTRSSLAISSKLRELEYDPGYQAIEGEYFHLKSIAAALGVSSSKMSKLARRSDVAAVLKVDKTADIGGYALVHISNLRKFIKKFPQEIANHKPDIAWLISILSEA